MEQLAISLSTQVKIWKALKFRSLCMSNIKYSKSNNQPQHNIYYQLLLHINIRLQWSESDMKKTAGSRGRIKNR